MRQVKLGLAAVLALIMLIVIFQNSGPAQVSLLFWHAQMPMIALLLLVATLGVLTGALLSMALGARKKRD